MGERGPLSDTTYEVFAAIQRLGPNCSNTDLAAEAGAAMQTVSLALTTLEERRYIKRTGGRYRQIELLRGSFDDRDTSQQKMRSCLGGCGSAFLSSGPGNRLCPKCAERIARAGSNIEHEYA